MALDKKIVLSFTGKRLGKVYHGSDEGISFSVLKNCTVKVSESLASRLLKDFPQDFERVEESTKVK